MILEFFLSVFLVTFSLWSAYLAFSVFREEKARGKIDSISLFVIVCFVVGCVFLGIAGWGFTMDFIETVGTEKVGMNWWTTFGFLGSVGLIVAGGLLFLTPVRLFRDLINGKEIRLNESPYITAILIVFISVAALSVGAGVVILRVLLLL